MTKFKMMKKPSEPKRENSSKETSIFNFSTLGEVVRFFSEIDIDINKVGITFAYIARDNEGLFVWEELESEKNFNLRISKYNKRLEEYNKWYAANKEVIDKYEKEQEEKRKFVRERKAEVREKFILKEQKRLQKELEKLWSDKK